MTRTRYRPRLLVSPRQARANRRAVRQEARRFHYHRSPAERIRDLIGVIVHAFRIR